MPGVIERPKMTRAMYQALKRHIMRNREKIKQAQEQDEELERQKREKELQRKKAEEVHLTLEQTKEQIQQLEAKLETMKSEKHELFSQLKKALHQEDETRRRNEQKERAELLQMQQQQQQQNQQYNLMQVGATPSIYVQGLQTQQSATKYMNVPVHRGVRAPMAVQQQGVKRTRSPSPPPGGSGVYPHYQSGKYPPSSYPSSAKQETYPQKPGYPTPQSGHVTYTTPSQTSHNYPHGQPSSAAVPQQPYTANQSPAGKFASQSAFTSYPSHYAHQQSSIKEHYPSQGGPGFTVQRLPQPGFLATSHAGPGGLNLHQQLEQANQKSGFHDDKLNVQQVMRSMPQQTGVQGHLNIPGQMAMTQAPSQQPKGSIMTGYPVRTQGGATTYPTPSVQVGVRNNKNPQTSPASAVRRPYPGQGAGQPFYPHGM